MKDFSLGKRINKAVTFIQKPCNFSDVNAGSNIYESQDYLKTVKIEYQSITGLFSVIIADELKYLKEYKFDTLKEKRKLTLENDYFVSDSFVGDSPFTLTNKASAMVYEKDSAYLCQKKGEELEDSDQSIYPVFEALDTYEMDEIFPLKSQNFLLFYAPAEEVEDEGNDEDNDEGNAEEGEDEDSYYDDNGDDENESKPRGYVAMLIPEYNQPKVHILSPSDVSYYKAEYFFYHNNNFLVYHRQSYTHSDHVKIEIYKRNGDLYQSMRLTLKGVMDHSYAKLIISPSGRYMFYCEEDENDSSKTVGRI